MNVEEQGALMREIAAAVREFVSNELGPVCDRLDKLEAALRAAKAQTRVRVPAGREDTK